MKNLIGQKVTLYINFDYKIIGTVSSHRPGLYQVTEDIDKYFVFWEYEIEKSNGNKLFHKYWFEQ